MAKVKALSAKRQSCINDLDELAELGQAAKTEPTLRTLFNVRYNRMVDTIRSFEETHAAIIDLISTQSEPDFLAEEVTRKRVLTTFYAIETLHIEMNPPITSSPVPASTNSISNTTVRLPKLSLGSFNGDFSQWCTFYQRFKTAIHENDNLPDVDKFQYLISCLIGEPLQLIKTFSISPENYSLAFQTLIETYDNKRKLASHYWNQINSAPKLSSESAKALRRLGGAFRENKASLEGLQLNSLVDFMWFSLLLDKLDSESRQRFEDKIIDDSSNGNLPTFAELLKFVEGRANVLDSVPTKELPKTSHKTSYNHSNSPHTSYIKPFIPRKALVANIQSSTSIVCPLCKDSHILKKCQMFLKKSPSERYAFVRQIRFCLNCLHHSHAYSNCSSTQSCRECHARHHTLLHFPRSVSSSSSSGAAKPDPPSSPTAEVTSCTSSLTSISDQNHQVLLSTVRLEILDKWGNPHQIRALIDPGSQSSIITSSLAQILELPRSRVQIPIYGIGHTPSEASKGLVTCQIRPQSVASPVLTVRAIILSKICGALPNTLVQTQNLDHIKGLALADPAWHKPGPIDLLLGADVYHTIILPGLLAGSPGHPIAMQTIFGWILSGPVPASSSTDVQSMLTCTSTTLDQALRAFWEVKEVPHTLSSCLDPDEQRAETIFLTTLYREPSGRFGVSLTFKTSPAPKFSNSLSIADRRWISQERRLLDNPDLHKLYTDFMKDYLESGHMTKLSAPPPGEECYFIPHHCVLKAEGVNRKIRVVCDASAKAANGLSLNDTLLIGAKLQSDIVSILLRFRARPIAIVCDIRQMYRQILMKPEHRNYQLIRFRFHPSTSIETYQLNTVTYGVSSSPFLAIRTLLHQADEHANKYPLAAQAIKSDRYVDDVASSADSISEALDLKTQLIALLETGCFELRKWASNSPDLLEDIPDSHLQTKPSTCDFAEESSIKILGLQWQASETADFFSFSVTPQNNPCTKRAILSEVARIYDPLGFIAPVTLFAKRLIQHLWTLGLGWDDSPSTDIQDQWQRYKSELVQLSTLEIARKLFSSPPSSCQLHGFCDASKVGYAAVLYVRYFINGNPRVSYLMAKSKVAPLKCLAIPRLELCSAVLLSNLVSYAIKTFSIIIDFEEVIAWTDSSVALSWIRSSPHRWKTFVANRVSHIQDRIPPESWRHVRSEDNPADPASRGLFPQEILAYPLWWAGPTFLTLLSVDWPISSFQSNTTITTEEESKAIFVTQTFITEVETLLNNVSSLRKIQGIISFCLRFSFNSRFPSARRHGPLSDGELHAALFCAVKVMQSQAFSSEISQLRKTQTCPKYLLKLSPFLDSEGILRVGGRLKHSSLPSSSKHPALLPREHNLTKMIINHTHVKYLHAGVSTTMYLIQQNFWVLSARRAIRRCLSRCMTCFRNKPISMGPPMGDLPYHRVSQVKPFSCVGVDYGGPFTITMSRTRGAKTTKAYICLFVCFATKALHVEVASDLSTDTFIAALRRFIARRGRCSLLFSDCGTNFVGANRELTKHMQLSAESEAIQWRFNPPSAPHFGGLWESGIKSVKTHLKRVIGEQIFTFEELATLVTQIEALLNSRPLCGAKTDPNDLSSLTPGHFLTMEPLTAPPDPDLAHLKMTRMSRWQLIQRMHQHFWDRWHREYLHTLYQRSKWFKGKPEPVIDLGTLVLIKDELTPPLKWKLGRITELFPGADGVVRVVSVRTSQGVMKRPLIKLCQLPGQ